MRRFSAVAILALAAFDSQAACSVAAMDGVWTSMSVSMVGEAHVGTCNFSVKKGQMSGTCIMQHPKDQGGDFKVNMSGDVTLLSKVISDPTFNDDGLKVCSLQMVANYQTGGASTWTIGLGNGGRGFTGSWVNGWGGEGAVTGVKQ